MTRSLNYFLKIFMFAQLMLLLLGAMAVNASESRGKDIGGDDCAAELDSLATTRHFAAAQAVATDLPATNDMSHVIDALTIP